MIRALLLLYLVVLAVPASAADCLWVVNWKRSQHGLYALQPDATLQAWAQRKANLQASRGRMGHLLRGAYPGRNEGVGMVSHSDPQGRSVLACTMTTRRHRFAGAACAVGRNGRTYYCVIYR